MKNRWFVYAYPAMYGGLHGMWDYEIVDNVSYEGACEDGYEIALQVIESYMRPEDQIYSRDEFLQDYYYDEWKDEYEDEYYNALDEAISEEAAYEVWHIRDDISDEVINKWEKNNIGDPKDFIKQYCEPVI